MTDQEMNEMRALLQRNITLRVESPVIPEMNSAGELRVQHFSPSFDPNLPIKHLLVFSPDSTRQLVAWIAGRLSTGELRIEQDTSQARVQ